MSTFEQTLIGVMEQLHPLDRIARAGYVLRGVPNPESVAAHSHAVAVLTLFIVDAYPETFDRHKALTMALLHDAPECEMMDIPMPAGDSYFREAKSVAESACFEHIFRDFSGSYRDCFEELQTGESKEAHLIRAMDKAQMMIRIMCYQREGAGRLDEFWMNPKNFDDFGLPEASRLFDAICERAGRSRPR